MSGQRKALSTMKGVIVVALVLVAAGGGIYFTNMNQTGAGKTIDLSIVEADPVNQIDAFSPANITLSHGTTVTLAIQNGDDETRYFQIYDLSINQTIISGQTQRVTFTVGAPGTYKMYSPQTLPSAVSNGRPGSAITGYLVVA